MATLSILLLILLTISLIAMGLLIRWMIIQMNLRQTGERETWIQTQAASSAAMSSQQSAFEQMMKMQAESMTTFAAQHSSTMAMQGQLLKRVLVGEDQGPLTQPTLNEPENAKPMSLEDELLLLPPHMRDQIIREEAERAYQMDPAMVNGNGRVDPRVKVIDPTRTPEEGSVIWSPPTSEG